MQRQTLPSLADSMCYLRLCKIKKAFFTQINSLLDWNSISNVISTHYQKKIVLRLFKISTIWIKLKKYLRMSESTKAQDFATILISCSTLSELSNRNCNKRFNSVFEALINQSRVHYEDTLRKGILTSF